MIRIAVAGLGAVGRSVVARLGSGNPGVELTAVAARDTEAAGATLRGLGVEVPVVAIDELEPLADLVVECAPAALLPTIAEPFHRRGKEVVVQSAGALLEHLLSLDGVWPTQPRRIAEHYAQLHPAPETAAARSVAAG